MDGCYWHGCLDHFAQPKTNVRYWSNKIAGNVARDRDTNARLTDAGWAVLRYWEHDDLDSAVDEIVEVVTARRPHLVHRVRSTSPAAR